MKDLISGIWGLIVLGSIAVFMGWIDIPKPVMALMDQFEGNSDDSFNAVVRHASGEQLRFIRAVSDSIQSYRDAPNEMAKGAVRPKRKEAICQVNNGYTDGEWAGVVETLSTNGDGDGVLSIKIAPHIVVKTWNNSLSDIGSDTLLKAGSPVHSVAVTLAEGDLVKFTGKFFQDDTDCIDEASLSIDESLSDPEFIIQFASLKKVEAGS